MKKKLAFLLLALTLLFTACGGPSLQTGDGAEKSTEEEKTVTEEISLPKWEGAVTLSGEGKADSTVTAKVETEEKSGLSYEWLLDGKPLKTRSDTLQIPATAEGKSLVCRVSSEGKDGTAESEAMTVLARDGGNRYTMAGLWEDVKWLNRTTPVKSGMAADWSASGFEMHLRSDGGEFRVYYQVNYSLFFAVFVDGVQVDRPLCSGSGNSFAVTLSAGEHTVKVCKETEVSTSSSCTLTGVEFAGEILERPADQELLIQVIGDSIACGDGSLGTYVSGQAWVLQDHSGTHGYAYLLGQALQVDVDIVARGGIGLIKAAGDYTIGQLYDYVNRYRSTKDMVNFETERVPDIIIVEQGANDSVNNGTCTETEYQDELLRFVKMLRQKWGDGPAIVWVGKNAGHYASAQNIKAYVGDRYHTFQFSYGGGGSAALATQSSGHPSATEQQDMANAIAAFLRENGIV